MVGDRDKAWREILTREVTVKTESKWDRVDGNRRPQTDPQQCPQLGGRVSGQGGRRPRLVQGHWG